MKKYVFLLAIFSGCSFLFAQDKTPETIVQQSLDAYNKGDLDLFMSYFSEKIAMQELNAQQVSASGKDEVLAIFKPFFKASPDLHSKILKRMVLGNKVIDHEYITGANRNPEAFQVIVIYEVVNDKIAKMTMVRPQPTVLSQPDK